MLFRRVNHFVWIIGGLSLSFLIWGGLGAIKVASSRAPEIVSPISMTRARREPGMFNAPGLLGVDATQTPNPETRTHVVESGDTLWSIAIKFYGNGAKYPLIQQANDLPDSARLHTGQILVIPFPETEKTPTPKAPTPASITPSPVPSIFSPTPTVSPSAVLSSQPFVTDTPTAVPAPDATSSGTGIATVIPLLGVVVNVLGVICLLASIICAMLSYDIFRRSRHYARRRYIGNRVRAGL